MDGSTSLRFAHRSYAVIGSLSLSKGPCATLAMSGASTALSSPGSVLEGPSASYRVPELVEGSVQCKANAGCFDYAQQS